MLLCLVRSTGMFDDWISAESQPDHGPAAFQFDLNHAGLLIEKAYDFPVRVPDGSQSSSPFPE